MATLKPAGFSLSGASLNFAKPPLTYRQQADLLLSRGLIVSDEAFFLRQLQSVGYYRLCAYWYPFKRPDNSFEPGTTFDTVWSRYRFDRQLRLSVMDAVERVEVAVRSALITELAMRHGSFAHRDAANFPQADPARHTRFLEELRGEARRSSEVFVQHFSATYDEFPDLPIWAAAETMTFGAMLTLFKMSQRKVQGDVAKRYGIAQPVLLSWLQTLNYVRNLCAHHARLWNRELALRPMIPDTRHAPLWHPPHAVPNNRVFAVLTLLHYLLFEIAPQSGWRSRLVDLFDRFPDVPILPMGMAASWREHPLWSGPGSHTS